VHPRPGRADGPKRKGPARELPVSIRPAKGPLGVRDRRMTDPAIPTGRWGDLPARFYAESPRPSGRGLS